MRLLLAILVAICLSGRLLAQPAAPNDLAVTWTATNEWPSSLWIYKVVPQHFAPAVISNLLAMAAFTMADNISTNGRWLFDLTDMNFETPDQKRHLWITERYGYIEYRDYLAEAAAEIPSQGVPTDKEAYPLALDYLRKFGIDRSQLAPRSPTNGSIFPGELAMRRTEETQGWTDKSTHKEVKDAYARGVFFVRQVDGVPIDGITHGGVVINFGNHAKITDLKITWRGLEPFVLRPTLTQAQIVNEIKQGHAKWRPNSPNGPIKQITVLSYDLFYRGQPGNADLDQQQKFVDPYVMIYASLGDGGTNDVKCYSEMPIFPP